MTASSDFINRIETKITQQLKSQRVGYLLGAGSSYLDGNGYPLSFELWNRIKDRIPDFAKRDEIQAKLNAGANGIEHALDLLDNGLPHEGPHRHLVTTAIADLFKPLSPPLNVHIEFVHRLNQRANPGVKIFSLNYDPLIERAAENARVRLCDGFSGNEHAFFDPATFEERIGRIRGSYKARQFDETARPLRLLKLHGSLGWYECPIIGVRRCAFNTDIPAASRRLMIPPQRRKASDTMSPPYATLWSAFRGALGQDAVPINRLVCLGYGFGDEHVNAVIEGALTRTDFTVLILTKELSDTTWNRWCIKDNVVIVTESRCALKGELGQGHSNLWNFEHIAKEV